MHTKFSVYPRKSRRLVSPKGLINLIKQDQDNGVQNLTNITFVPPKIGEKHFGYFVVDLNTATINLNG